MNVVRPSNNDKDKNIKTINIDGNKIMYWYVLI